MIKVKSYYRSTRGSKSQKVSGYTRSATNTKSSILSKPVKSIEVSSKVTFK